MNCTIPNFNLAVRVTYDLSNTTPSITIDNQTTGSSMTGIKFWFVISTPSGIVFHQGSFSSPDATGIWSTVNISEPIPQTDGHIEFNSALPYKVSVFAQDASGNTCQKDYEDIICVPNGGSGKTNFGAINLNSFQNCEKGYIEIVDQTNYQYKGITGNMVSNSTKFVYPADSNGTIPTPATVNNKMAFLLPIPVNGDGHQLIRNAIQTYTMPETGNVILIKYKYKNSDITIDCGTSMCSILCGLTKYREKLESCDSCKESSVQKITSLTNKISQLALALNSPLCGFDISKLRAEIKEELLVNDCVCEDCGDTGNNPSWQISCAGIDIACVNQGIVDLINADANAKAAWCTIVSSCISEQGGCQAPLITGLVINSSQINVNFILPVQGTSQNLEVFYKLASAVSWTSAGTLASNSTSKVITGSFTPNDIYQVKVTNNCSGNTKVDSIVSSAIVVSSIDQCYLLDKIYGGLSNGLYVIERDNSGSGCDKNTPVKIDKTIISQFLPCEIPENFKVSSTGILSWTGTAPAEYRISYKLKTSGTWTVQVTAAFVGVDSTFDILTAASLTNPIQDYDFRIERFCGGSEYSLPVYCSYDLAPVTGCKSPSGFIEWNESTGIVKFYGGVPSGTYIVSAYNITTGASLAAPTTTTVDANGIISANYANILGSTSIGQKINFSVKTDCGLGNYSESVSFTYKRLGSVSTCPAQPVIFDPNTGVALGEISGNRVEIKIGSGALLSTTKRVLYRMRVNGVEMSFGDVNPTDNTSTFIQSPKGLKNGDTLEFSYRTFGSCCDGYTSDSGWSSWAGGVISIQNGWDDQWVALPGSGAFLNSYVSSPTYNSKFKIDKEGSIHLRGAVRSATVASLANGASLSVNLGFLDLSAGTIFSSAKDSIISSPDYDVFPVNITGTTCTVSAQQITRNGAVLTISATLTNNTGSTLTNFTYEFGIGHITLR